MKEVRIFSLVIGLYYMLSSGGGFLADSIMQVKADANADPFYLQLQQLMDECSRVARMLNPILLFLGMAFVLYSIFLYRMGQNRFGIFVFLSVASLGWFMLEMVFFFPVYYDIFSLILERFHISQLMVTLICILGFLFTLGQFTVPQIYITYKLYRLRGQTVI